MMKSPQNSGETPDGNVPEQTHLKSLGKLDAIASGVQARMEETLGYSKRVTEETVSIARALGVTGPEIERWVTYRMNRLSKDTEKMRGLKTLLHKANRI